MRLTTLVLVVFVIGYMGYHIVDALRDPLRTVTCVLVRTEDAHPVSGLFVREETLMELPEGTLRYAVSDGERVSGGQTVAMRYQDSRVLDAAAELRVAENHLEQLLYINNRTVSASESAQAKAQVRESLNALLDTVDNRAWLGLGQSGKDLRNALFRQEYTLGDRADLAAQMEATQRRIGELRLEVEASYMAIPSPQGGLFVSAPDGYENLLRPADIKTLTAAGLDALMKAKAEPLAPNAGKLITDSEYRYLFTIPETEVWKLGKPKNSAKGIPGDNVKLRFHDETSSFIQSMELESLSEAEDGRCVVTLTSRRYLLRFYNRRKMDADVVYSEHEGLRVPREALYLDEDGSCYVFCRILSQVVKKPVEIIQEVERDNFYLCGYQPGGTKNLLPGDELIIGKDLYDGKVIN